MIFCKELNKYFETKKAMLKALRNNHDKIIAAKKAQIYNSKKGENKGGINITPINKNIECVKGLNYDDDYYYIAVNTTRILDSHEDVSIDGSWNKTAKEQQGKVYLILDHDFGVLTTVVDKSDIELMVIKVPFAILKLPYEGETEALIYKFRKDKVINQIAKDWLESSRELQASVRVQYVKILFALNSDDEEDKEYKKNYLKYIDTIANKSDFKEIDYFFPVIEQKNVLESSLVLLGSNHATGQIEESQPSKDTEHKTIEPSKDTHNINYNYLINKFKGF